MISLMLLIGHFICDFILQSKKMVREKENQLSKMLLHGTIYTVIMGLGLLVSLKWKNIFIPLIIIGISHFLIDVLKVKIDKVLGEKIRLPSYFIDQSLHIIIILSVTLCFDLNQYVGGILKWAIDYFTYTNVNNILVYVLIYLIMFQPAAITVKIILSLICKKEGEELSIEENELSNVGYTIGILERILIATLVLVNQLPTIGFVLAAKSLARFKQLEDKDFAEKYLVGTLSSLGLGIVVTLILKTLIIH